MKNSKKIYWLSPLFVLSVLFAQSFQKDGNLLKLNDGRIIEINEQIMEDYFFFEIDNSKIPEGVEIPQIDFESSFEADLNSLSVEEELNQSSSPQDGNEPFSLNPSTSPVSQSLRVPANDSLRGKFDSKSMREKADQEVEGPQRYDESRESDPTLKSDTQAFDLNNVPNNYSQDNLPNNYSQDNLPNNYSQEALIKTQNSNLRESDPNNQLSTQSNNEQPFRDNSNINNINLNLYNLTNLLDQVFSQNKNQVENNKGRNQEWEEAYQRILEQEALQVIPNVQTNAVAGDEESRLKDFIIKLPLLYDLIYGDQRALPPEKPPTTQPTDVTDVKKDEMDYYKKSVELLQAILRSFPDINNQSVNVVIITNTSSQPPTPPETQNEKYYDTIDKRYQQEFEGLRKKYNYNVGLELAQIKTLFTKKQYSLVLKKLHQLEEIEPYNTRIKNIIGSAYYKIGFYEFAERYWQESLNLNSNQPLVEAYLNRIREYGSSTIGDIEDISE